MNGPLNAGIHQPENQSLLDYLKRGWKSTAIPESVSPASVKDPYYTLGTHPDLVERLWDQLAASLPEKCQWVVYGNPVLIHPKSGIVFAFAGGTHTYAFRLPDKERQEALKAGAQRVHVYSNNSRLDLDLIGQEWVFGGWFASEEQWCQAAYHFAEKAASPSNDDFRSSSGSIKC